jgi:2,3-diketo-5-methylthiopentyl-1-phosphate enolase
MLPLLFEDLGRDFIVGTGGAVFGHPLGPAAGARALRQAIDRIMTEGSLQGDGKFPPELERALDLWGISEVGVKGPYELVES